MIRVDARRGALQQQIFSSIRHAIVGGVLRPGTRLPSSRELALDLAVSRTTTVLALEQLQAEGYLTTRRGAGTFVALSLPDDAPPPSLTAPARHPCHPPLSTRGAALAATRPGALRLGGAPRPFRIGTPAVDLFPIRLWSRLWSRRLSSATPSQLDYGEAAGFPALREAIADHVRASRGARCTPDQVFVVPGAAHAINLLCRVLLDPGDEAWLEEPGYPGAHSALVAAGARIHSVPVDEGGLDVEAGARRRLGARLVYVTPSHQFPLGVPMALPRRLALLQWAAQAGAWILEDDYDSEFRYGARPIPCLQGLDTDGRVIYVGSFSKTLFPSLRLGFMIVPPDLRDPLVAVRRNAEMYPPLLDQAVLADFILGGHFERHLRRMRTAYLERLHALQGAVGRHCDGALRLRGARSGLHVVGDLAEAEAEAVFAESGARGVEVTPLAAYFFGAAARPPNALVLGFGSVRPSSVEDGVKRLASALEASRRAPTSRAAPAARAGGRRLGARRDA